jgi:hypothetical protein
MRRGGGEPGGLTMSTIPATAQMKTLTQQFIFLFLNFYRR